MEFAGRAEPLTSHGVARAAESLGVSPEALWTVVVVETSGRGFLPDRRPQVLFERHEFRRRTGGAFDTSHPDISGKPGGYGPAGAHQHDRLAIAIACDRRAALESTSWGLGQIMGYNAALAGHSDAESLVEGCCESEDEQLMAMARFILGRRLHNPLAKGDWAAFARSYNGPSYAANQYDSKLAANHKALQATGLPDLQLRAAQLMLTYEGFDPGPVDGRTGRRSREAIARFRESRGLRQGDQPDEELLLALRAGLSDVRHTGSGVDPRAGQAMLAALGFDPGQIDGRDGPRTRAALDRAVLDGAPTGELADNLAAALARPAASAQLVKLVQGALGLQARDLDGLQGPRTNAAAAEFRRRSGLAAAEGLDAPLIARLLVGMFAAR
jgi:peptidoglycan hydrolase-like protein with peptidoglycan-binding domain